MSARPLLAAANVLRSPPMADPLRDRAPGQRGGPGGGVLLVGRACRRDEPGDTAAERGGGGDGNGAPAATPAARTRSSAAVPAVPAVSSRMVTGTGRSQDVLLRAQGADIARDAEFLGPGHGVRPGTARDQAVVVQPEGRGAVGDRPRGRDRGCQLRGWPGCQSDRPMR